MELKKITSFTVDHRKVGIGMYISRIDGDIATYDVRMCKPNGGVYMDYAAMHTIEHLFATYARSSELGENVVYVGPMGCRTGFYLLTRGISHEQALQLAKDSFAFIADFKGEIPGCSEIECGNYLEHDLEGAKREIAPWNKAMENYSVENMNYPQ